MLRIHEIKLGLDEEIDAIPEQIAKKLGVKDLNIEEWRLVKESIDARDKGDMKRVYSVDFTVRAENRGAELVEAELLNIGEMKKIKIARAPDMEYRFVTESLELAEGGGQESRPVLASPPVVVGFGPCGMFAGLLLAQMGYCPVILERGKAIEHRVRDVEGFWKDGILNPESNVQFGEGGAGAFSDGKLTTQIKDNRVRKVLTELVAAGGGEDLLYKQKPHIGTDVLQEVVKHIRMEILRLGGRVEFESRLTGLVLKEDSGEGKRRIAAVEINGGAKNGGRTLEVQSVVLALGHSARDTLRTLHEQGIQMEQKPFSMGVRIEHPQSMVNEAQYGKGYEKYGLDAADYKLAHRCQSGRGVYTFCMCPGGRVIASASCEGGVVTNGMSYRDRGLENANSGLLVDVKPEDFGSDHPLAGLAFQEKYEKLAFEAGGSTYKAPAQRVGDFMYGKYKQDKKVTRVRPSYEPAVCWTSIESCLPEFVVQSLKEALPVMGRRMRGFDRPDAVLTAVESRSSSPVRIPRNEDLTCNIEGIYPGGEGAGFAGGITSSAVDGIRIAEAIALKYQRR